MSLCPCVSCAFVKGTRTHISRGVDRQAARIGRSFRGSSESEPSFDNSYTVCIYIVFVCFGNDGLSFDSAAYIYRSVGAVHQRLFFVVFFYLQTSVVNLGCLLSLFFLRYLLLWLGPAFTNTMLYQIDRVRSIFARRHAAIRVFRTPNYSSTVFIPYFNVHHLASSCTEFQA